jgi:hypothetical protein
MASFGRGSSGGCSVAAPRCRAAAIKERWTGCRSAATTTEITPPSGGSPRRCEPRRVLTAPLSRSVLISSLANYLWHPTWLFAMSAKTSTVGLQYRVTNRAIRSDLSPTLGIVSERLERPHRPRRQSLQLRFVQGASGLEWSLSPRPCRDALVAMHQSARRDEFLNTDAVRLRSWPAGALPPRGTDQCAALEPDVSVRPSGAAATRRELYASGIDDYRRCAVAARCLPPAQEPGGGRGSDAGATHGVHPRHRRGEVGCRIRGGGNGP